MKLTGVIACGGASSRMGMDKSLLEYHGQSQRNHLKHLLSEICEDVFLSLNRDQKDSSVDVIYDNEKYSGLGPATGLLSAFELLDSKNILFIGCDYPMLSIHELNRFIKYVDPGHVSSFYNSNGFYEPLMCIIPYSCRATLVQHLLELGSLQKAFQFCKADMYLPLDDETMRSVDDLVTFNTIKDNAPGRKTIQYSPNKKRH